MHRTGRRALLAAFPLLLACSGAEAPPAGPPLNPPPASTIAAPPVASPSGAAAAAAPVEEKVASDTPRTTAAGATFTVPAGWTLRSDGAQRVLSGPEPGLRIAIVDRSEADADAAVAAAWQAFNPRFKRPLKIAQDRAAKYGWEQHRAYNYETSPDERAVVYATALRKGSAWTVIAVDASTQAFERRAAQVRLIRDSLRPSGYTRESFKGKTAKALDAERIKEITGFVDRAREEAGVPGVAISLVQGGKVVFEGGLGVRELGKPAKVDADTLFMIASNTKALTTLMLAKLVDEGKLKWDTPVASVYPGFKLGDAAVTSKVLVKHLICACTGLPRRDLEWLFEYKNGTAKATVDFLGSVQPTTGFGEVFQYSNLLAATAGFIGGYVADPKREMGAAYDEAMRARVLEPLGMKSTTFDFARALRGNHAWPHAEDIDGKVSRASMDVNYSIVPVRPTGGAWSSARELTRYVQMELAKGTLPDGKRYISEENLLARRAPQVASGEDQTYGMGLSVGTQYGTPVVSHGGSMFGFKSDMFWLPEHGVGGVILTNGNSGGMLSWPFIRKTLEVLFDGRPEAAEELSANVKARKAYIAKERERLVLPPDPALTAKLGKRYANAALGEIAVQVGPKSTVFDFGEWRSAVASRRNDDATTSFYTIDPGVNGFELVVAERDGKRALVMRDMQHEYVFLEKP